MVGDTGATGDEELEWVPPQEEGGLFCFFFLLPKVFCPTHSSNNADQSRQQTEACLLVRGGGRED